LVQDQKEQGAKTTKKRLTNLAKNVQNIQPVHGGLVALLVEALLTTLETDKTIHYEV
jgi:hypothetical protein